LRLWPLPSD